MNSPPAMTIKSTKQAGRRSAEGVLTESDSKNSSRLPTAPPPPVYSSSLRTLATIGSLAPETLDEIMRMLRDSFSLSWNGQPTKGRYDALRAAALVCSRWRVPAQRALFDELVLTHTTSEHTSQFSLASLAQARPTRGRCGPNNMCQRGNGCPSRTRVRG